MRSSIFSHVAALLLAVSLGAPVAHADGGPAKASPPVAHADGGPAKAIHGPGPSEVSYQEAAQQMGRHVYIATGSAMPPRLLPELRKVAMARDGETNALYMATFAGSDNFGAESQKKWHPHLLFVSGSARDAATHASEGRATVHRASLFQHAKAIKSGELPVDTVVTLVSPPDKDGMVSLGTTSDLTQVAVQRILDTGKGKIIAVVNPNVPHMKGNQIPYNRLSHVVHDDQLLLEATSNLPHPAEDAIARHIAALVPSDKRITLQIGIGNALVAVAPALKDHPKDWFAEMASQQVMENLGDGKATFAFLHGMNTGYQRVAKNPNVRMAPSSYVNDPEIIASHPHPVSINTALQVDEEGNVNAEQIGAKVIGAIGGQVDFMMGASRAPEGKAIMAVRSSALLPGGEASTVVEKLEGPVTTPKQFVDYVVTEWGATARLRALSANQRAFEILKVSHPLFRSGLAKSALTRQKITAEQAATLETSVVPSIRNAPLEMRAKLTTDALAAGLLTKEAHDEIQFGIMLAEANGAAAKP